MTPPAAATPVSPIPAFAKDGGRALLAWLRDMRDQHPVWCDTNQFWNVFRYADVRQASAEPAVFSSDLSRLNPGMSSIQRGCQLARSRRAVPMLSERGGQIRRRKGARHGEPYG